MFEQLLKQGTNEFHRSLLSLIRTSALTQKSCFVRTGNLPKPDTREDQYGGSLAARALPLGVRLVL